AAPHPHPFPTRRSSDLPLQDLLQLREELLPAGVGSPVGLLLIGPEAQLLHAQVSPRARWGERKGHHALQIVGRIVVLKIPSVGRSEEHTSELQSRFDLV